MSLVPDGHAALTAILENPDLFNRVKPGDLSGAAVKLAKKQLTAAGQDIAVLRSLKTALGDDVFDKTLDALSPHHIKQLARRLDKNAPEIEINTGSSALSHVRKLLRGTLEPESTPIQSAQETPGAEPDTPKKNKYLGRKAFRTGR